MEVSVFGKSVRVADREAPIDGWFFTSESSDRSPSAEGLCPFLFEGGSKLPLICPRHEPFKGKNVDGLCMG